MCCELPPSPYCHMERVEPPNKGHFGEEMNWDDLFFVERCSSLRGSICIAGIILGL